ncbi:MAG: HlyD family efflux transporter periplasmic adaptor subunit [Acidimicrobiales bacterium]|nr:HlyD family efflux transporter periplasmic adaptor subunit [Acidimicrobiales bacterium]
MSAPSLASPGRRWPLVLVGAAVGAVGVLVAQQLAPADATRANVIQTVELATAEVTTADLVEEVEWAGEVAYADKTVMSGAGGIVTATTPAGTVVERGDILVEINARPVILFYGKTPTYRSIQLYDQGPDVLVLETNLVELGFDPDGTVTVDEEFTYYTELMVMRWQEALGIEATGTVEASYVLVQEGAALLLDEPLVGTQATGDLLTLAPQADLTITVPVDVAEADEFAINDPATVILSDDTERTGSVTKVGTEVTTDQNGSTVDVIVALSDGNGDLLEGTVTVRTFGQEIRDATVVPTRALVALAEGGFAVEKVTGTGTTELIGIEIGAFDGGVVEVVTGSIEPGDEVMVPQ